MPKKYYEKISSCFYNNVLNTVYLFHDNEFCIYNLSSSNTSQNIENMLISDEFIGLPEEFQNGFNAAYQQDINYIFIKDKSLFNIMMSGFNELLFVWSLNFFFNLKNSSSGIAICWWHKGDVLDINFLNINFELD